MPWRKNGERPYPGAPKTRFLPPLGSLIFGPLIRFLQPSQRISFFFNLQKIETAG